MGRQTLCGPQPAKITVVSLFVFNRLFPHNWGGLFRSAFWFVWWNLQEIYHGFDKSRTMWVFQHKLFFFENFWNPVEGVNSAEDLVTRLEKFSKFKQTDQSRFLDAKIIKRWKLLNFLFSVRKYSIGNTTSRERVQPFIDAEEKVNQLPGVSKIHQAFSTGER